MIGSEKKSCNSKIAETAVTKWCLIGTPRHYMARKKSLCTTIVKWETKAWGNSPQISVGKKKIKKRKKKKKN